MTISILDAALYAFAVFILFLTPGTVWVAIIARAMHGGLRAAWPLAVGVVIGDLIWPLLAILGVSWLVNEIEGFMTVLRYFAALVFVFIGFQLIRTSDRALGSDSRLTKPGLWAGFVAGVMVILSNPKAIVFYMGILPGFFDLSNITLPDIVIVLIISFTVPLLGNLVLAAMVEYARGLLQSPEALKRLNIVSGVLLIIVGCVIPFT